MKYAIRRLIREYSRLHLPFVRRKWAKWKKENSQETSPSVPVTDETELVVDGFPRSGNSFFTALIEVTQPPDLKLAHHVHSFAQIAEGIRRGIPTIVVVRDPKEAVLSYMAYDPNIDLRTSLLDWISFYRRVLSLNGRFAIALFSDFTKNPSTTIQKINCQLKDHNSKGQLLHEFDPAEAALAARKHLDDKSQQWFSRKCSSFPSEDRDRVKAKLKTKLKEKTYADLLAEASSIFESLNRKMASCGCSLGGKSSPSR